MIWSSIITPMKLTKYQHACFVVEHDGQAVVVDPGGFSDDFVMPNNLVGVVLTHQHPDHVDPGLLSDIVRRYPDVTIYATDDTPLDYSHLVATPGQTVQLASFQLTFTGGNHALIDSSIPLVQNIGVLINGLLYYPGDSFARPDRPVHTLLLPVAAPWLKISETLDYLRAIRPQQVVPTHDAILSEAGRGIVDRLVGAACDELAIPYRRLAADGSLTIKV